MNLIKSLCLIIYTFQVAAEFSAVKDVVFFVRTKKDQMLEDKVLVLKDLKSLEASGIDPKKPTSIVIHGYTEDHKSKHHVQLSEALLDKTDQNVIVIDWSAGAKTLIYSKARYEVSEVGEVIAQQLDFMNENIKLDFSTVTVIGFSLGAHVAGFTGKNVKNGKVGMIVGLDPAGPLFDTKKPDTCLAETDGVYVIAIHTSQPFGIRKPLANADFFFNTGEKQPGCMGGGWLDVCSHIRAVNYYAEAMKNPKAFWGIRCSSASQALTGKCSDSPNAFVGDPKLAKGIFSIRTNSHSPFGIGQSE